MEGGLPTIDSIQDRLIQEAAGVSRTLHSMVNTPKNTLELLVQACCGSLAGSVTENSLSFRSALRASRTETK